MTIARTFTIDAQRVDTPALVTGYVLALFMCWAYSRRCRAGVFKDRRIAELTQRLADRDSTIGRLDNQVAIVEAERDEAIRNWTGWFKRAMTAETERDQGVPGRLGRRRCLTTTAGETS